MLSAEGLFADVDTTGETLNKKIRNGETSQYNFILGTSTTCLEIKLILILCMYVTVVGQQEEESRSVNVRNRDDVGTKNQGAMESLDEVTKKLVNLKKTKSLQNNLA